MQRTSSNPLIDSDPPITSTAFETDAKAKKEETVKTDLCRSTNGARLISQSIVLLTFSTQRNSECNAYIRDGEEGTL